MKNLNSIKAITLMLLLCLTLSVFWGCDSSKNDIYPNDTEDTTSSDLSDDIYDCTEQYPAGSYSEPDIDDLRSHYPEYFGLDTSNGLDIYVWQLAADHYGFALLEHSSTPLYQELLNLRGVSARSMRVILESYGISPENITIIPWQNPISSYIIMSGDGGSDYREAYIYNIWLMLFDEAYIIYDAYYSTYLCDVDGDGNIEICALSDGWTSGVSSLMISAREAYGTEPEYRSLILTGYWLKNPRFLPTEDGLCVYGLDNAGEQHFLYVKLDNGELCLYEENGEKIHCKSYT